MTVEATVDYAEPKPQRSDQALRAQATATAMRRALMAVLVAGYLALLGQRTLHELFRVP